MFLRFFEYVVVCLYTVVQYAYIQLLEAKVMSHQANHESTMIVCNTSLFFISFLFIYYRFSFTQPLI